MCSLKEKNWVRLFRADSANPEIIICANDLNVPDIGLWLDVEGTWFGLNQAI